ncbi:C6 zinc finger domain-containing protein [Botrytis cinerea]
MSAVDPAPRTRRRAAHACDVCRLRKIRCDGHNPCATCIATDQDCSYGIDVNPRGKNDSILEGVLRIERYLQDMNAMMAASPAFMNHHVANDHNTGSPQTAYSGGATIASPLPQPTARPRHLSFHDEQSVHNAPTALSVLALLMMSLGCASQSIINIAVPRDLTSDEHEYYKQRKLMADICFDEVLKRLYIPHTEMSSTAVQCLFYTAVYFAFSQRPLQAWEYINATAAKCRLLLSYHSPGESAEDVECLRRIFWSCYILESDYLAELSGLPESGLASIESTIPLPGSYDTHESQVDEEHSSLYFLACISMRRLLNRVHNLLYAKETGASLDDARFPFIVEELDHQLEEWRDFLPPALQFVVDTQPAQGQHAGFLRQRYLTCRSVIYRPYLTWVLTNHPQDINVAQNVLEKCRNCLDACLLHIINLRGFAHTVMMDTWICSLSMTGAMLVLLAASRLPYLRNLLGQDVTNIGSHLQTLIKRWVQIPGENRSPSIEQSLRMIGEIDVFLHQEFGTEKKD